MTPENSRSDPPEASAPDGVPSHTHDQKAINAALAGAAGMLIGRFLFGRHGGLLGGVAGLGAGYFLKRGTPRPAPVVESIPPDSSQTTGISPAPPIPPLPSDGMVQDSGFSPNPATPTEGQVRTDEPIAVVIPSHGLGYAFEASSNIESDFADVPAGSAAFVPPVGPMDELLQCDPVIPSDWLPDALSAVLPPETAFVAVRSAIEIASIPSPVAVPPISENLLPNAEPFGKDNFLNIFREIPARPELADAAMPPLIDSDPSIGSSMQPNVATVESGVSRDEIIELVRQPIAITMPDPVEVLIEPSVLTLDAAVAVIDPLALFAAEAEVVAKSATVPVLLPAILALPVPAPEAPVAMTFVREELPSTVARTTPHVDEFPPQFLAVPDTTAKVQTSPVDSGFLIVSAEQIAPAARIVTEAIHIPARFSPLPESMPPPEAPVFGHLRVIPPTATGAKETVNPKEIWRKVADEMVIDAADQFPKSSFPPEPMVASKINPSDETRVFPDLKAPLITMPAPVVVPSPADVFAAFPFVEAVAPPPPAPPVAKLDEKHAPLFTGKDAPDWLASPPPHATSSAPAGTFLRTIKLGAMATPDHRHVSVDSAAPFPPLVSSPVSIPPAASIPDIIEEVVDTKPATGVPSPFEAFLSTLPTPAVASRPSEPQANAVVMPSSDGPLGNHLSGFFERRDFGLPPPVHTPLDEVPRASLVAPATLPPVSGHSIPLAFSPATSRSTGARERRSGVSPWRIFALLVLFAACLVMWKFRDSIQKLWNVSINAVRSTPSKVMPAAPEKTPTKQTPPPAEPMPNKERVPPPTSQLAGASQPVAAAPVTPTVAPLPKPLAPLPPSANTDPKELAARETIIKLFSAITINDAAPFVLDASRIAADMKLYYGKSPVTGQVPGTLELLKTGNKKIGGNPTYFFRVDANPSPPDSLAGYPIAVLDTSDGLKTDWAFLMQCRDRHLERFVINKKAAPGQFFVNLSRSHAFGSGIATKEMMDNYTAWNVRSPIVEDPGIFAFVAKSNATMMNKIREYKWNTQYSPVVELAHVDEHIEITNIIRPQWPR